MEMVNSQNSNGDSSVNNGLFIERRPELVQQQAQSQMYYSQGNSSQMGNSGNMQLGLKNSNQSQTQSHPSMTMSSGNNSQYQQNAPQQFMRPRVEVGAGGQNLLMSGIGRR